MSELSEMSLEDGTIHSLSRPSSDTISSPSAVPVWHAALLNGLDPAVRVSSSRNATDTTHHATPNRSKPAQPATPTSMMTKQNKQASAKKLLANCSVASSISASSSISDLTPCKLLKTPTTKRTLSFESHTQPTKHWNAPVPAEVKGEAPKVASSSVSSSLSVPSPLSSSVRLFSPNAKRIPSLWSPSHPIFHRMRLYSDRAAWLQSIMELDYFKQCKSEYAFVFTEIIKMEQTRQLEAALNNIHLNQASNRPLDDQQPGSLTFKNSGRGLETYTQILLRLKGWSRVEVKAGPQDGGIDVLGERSTEAELTEQVVVQCKQYYPASGTSDLSMDVVSAFHSALMRLAYFNQQTLSSESRLRLNGSEVETPTVAPLLPEPSRIQYAYLITTGTFSQQSQQFVTAFNRDQANKRQQWKNIDKLMQSSQLNHPLPDNIAATLLQLHSRHTADFLGTIELIDGRTLEDWVYQIELQYNDPELFHREEVNLAIESEENG